MSAMWRALTPYLLIAALVMLAAAITYGLGAPAWLAYAAIVLAILTVPPGYDRWQRHQHPR